MHPPPAAPPPLLSAQQLRQRGKARLFWGLEATPGPCWLLENRSKQLPVPGESDEREHRAPSSNEHCFQTTCTPGECGGSPQARPLLPNLAPLGVLHPLRTPLPPSWQLLPAGITSHVAPDALSEAWPQPGPQALAL